MSSDVLHRYLYQSTFLIFCCFGVGNMYGKFPFFFTKRREGLCKATYGYVSRMIFHLLRTLFDVFLEILFEYP